jgi:electron transfer flavoprotein alpha subunit
MAEAVKSCYGVEEARQAIWVFLEQEDEALSGVSLEILSKGRALADQSGWPLVGLLMGAGLEPLHQAAIHNGADELLVADHPALAPFTVEAFAHVAYGLIVERRPSVFLLGATPNGRDLAGRLAVRLRTGLNADCTDLLLDQERGVLVSEVSGFGGGVLAMIEMPAHRPQMATVRPGVFPRPEPDRGRTGRVSRARVDVPDGLIRTRIVQRVAGQGLDLTQTPALVVGGRGVGGDFAMLYELASLLGGDVGATRPPVDEGHIQRERQIGQTGAICRPKAAVVCGASGAFQFTVGIQEAGIVVAINTDPEAPIFEEADYCVVGDVHQVVPAMIAALRAGHQGAKQAATSDSSLAGTEVYRG